MATPIVPLNDESIQRVLFLAPKVHVYQIPPLRSAKGYQASNWTNPLPHDPSPAREIFLARIRILETATPLPAESKTRSKADGDLEEDLSVSVLLEDPSTGDLFAEAPYTSQSVIEPATDSSRFFAIRVVGPGNGSNAKPVTAMLGIGFEDRSEAMEFGICLQESAKVLRFSTKGKIGAGTAQGANEAAAKSKASLTDERLIKKDWSLKEGESIRVDIGPRKQRKDEMEGRQPTGKDAEGDIKKALFSIKAPPGPAFSELKGGGGTDGEGDITAIPLLAPPPRVPLSRAEKRRSRELTTGAAAQQKKEEVEALGFDDGEFGEFQ